MDKFFLGLLEGSTVTRKNIDLKIYLHAYDTIFFFGKATSEKMNGDMKQLLNGFHANRIY